MIFKRIDINKSTVTDPVKKMLLQLQNREMSSGELRKKLDLSHRATFRENYLHPALNSGFIEYTIPGKPTSRLQKYRITGKGKRFLSGVKNEIENE